MPATGRSSTPAIEQAVIYSAAMFAGVGVVLAAVELRYNRSLWMDEAMLSLNVLHRGFLGLLQPLDEYQVAPIGFLMAQKAAVLLFGPGERALRALPFVSFLVSIPLVYTFVETVIGDSTVAALSMACFAIAHGAVDYATEVKQYMVDVPFALLILVLAARVDVKRRRSIAIVAAAGSLAVVMSNVSVITLAIAALWLACVAVRERHYVPMAAAVAAWGVTFAIYYAAFIHGHPNQGRFLSYYVDAFPSLNPLRRGFLRFINQALGDVWRQMFRLNSYWRIAEFFSLVGIGDLLVRRQVRAVLFLTGPIGLHFILAGLHLYPFTGRFLLYTLPLFVVIAMNGAVCVVRLLRGWLPAPRLAVGATLLLLMPPFAMVVAWRGEFPIEKEEIKRSLALLTQREDRDPVYVYYGALPAFAYYREIGVAPPLEAIEGAISSEAPVAYDQQLNALHGIVWLLFSHVSEHPAGTADEETLILSRLQQHGGRMLSGHHFTGSSVYHVALDPDAVDRR